MSTSFVLAKKLFVPEVILSQVLGSFVRDDRGGVVPGRWNFGNDGFGKEGKLANEDFGLELLSRAVDPLGSLATLFSRPLNGFHQDGESSARTRVTNARETIAPKKDHAAAFNIFIIHLLCRAAKAAIAT